MKKQILLLGLLSLAGMQLAQSAQFAKNAARSAGKFLWAPSIGLGALFGAVGFKAMNDQLQQSLDNARDNSHLLDSNFVQEVQDEANKRGLRNVKVIFNDHDFGVPNIQSQGSPEQSNFIVNCGWGVSPWERLRKTFENGDSRDVFASFPSKEERCFVMGHELAHIQNNDTQACNLETSVRAMIPFFAWRAARYNGRTRLAACGAIGLGSLVDTVIQGIFGRMREYRADYNASQDPQIVEAGAQFMDRGEVNMKLLENRLKIFFSNIKNGIKPSEEEVRQVSNDLKSLIERSIVHPRPAKRAERLRDLAKQLRVEAAEKN